MYYYAISASIIDASTGSTINTGAAIRASTGSAPGASFGGTTLTIGGTTNTSSSTSNYYFRADVSTGYTFSKFECYCSELGSSSRTQTFTANPTGKFDLGSVVGSHTSSGKRLKIEVRLYVTRNSFKITYNANGGSSTPSTQTVYQGSSTNLAAAISRSGYTFKGWLINGTVYSAGASYTPTANVTATAQWEGSSGSVTFIVDGVTLTKIEGTTGDTIGSSGTFAWPTVTLQPGLTLTGWQINGTTYSLLQQYTISGNQTANAVYSGSVTTGTYDLTEQNITGYEASLYDYLLTIVIAQNGVVTNNFPSWLSIATAASQIKTSRPGAYFNTGTTLSSVNYGVVSGLVNNLTGVLDGKDASVTGTRSEHSGTIHSFTAGFRGEHVFTISPPSGYEAYGWFYGTGYGPDHHSSSFKKGKSISLHIEGGRISAEYPYQALVPILIKKHKVTFDANGGTGAPNAIEMAHGEYWTCPMTLPTKDGYTCKGWSLSKTATAPEYVAGRNYGPLNGDLTVYAVWAANRGTLAFNANGGKVSPEYKAVKVGEAYGTLPTPTLQGANFLGWFTDAVAGEEVTAETRMDVTGLAIVYAHWDKSAFPDTTTYTVRFIDPTGTNPEASRKMTVGKSERLAWITSGLAWTAPAGHTAPTPIWALNPFLDPIYENGAYVTDLAGPGETVELYAIWKAREFTVTFDANGGTCDVATKTVAYGEIIGKLPTPTREGYIFDGWYTSATGGTRYTRTSTTTSSRTLYAHWTEATIFDWWAVTTD